MGCGTCSSCGRLCCSAALRLEQFQIEGDKQNCRQDKRRAAARSKCDRQCAKNNMGIRYPALCGISCIGPGPWSVPFKAGIIGPACAEPEPEAERSEKSSACCRDAVEGQVCEQRNDSTACHHHKGHNKRLPYGYIGEIPFEEPYECKEPENDGKAQEPETGNNGIQPQPSGMEQGGNSLEGEEGNEGGDDAKIGIPVVVIKDVIPVDRCAIGEEGVAFSD